MTVPPEQLVMVQRWVEKAEEDYRNFQNTLKMSDDCPLDTVCFHAQQCVEKYPRKNRFYG